MQLVAEKRFASLTIQDVTSQAGLNRTTFYLHYSGLHELLEFEPITAQNSDGDSNPKLAMNLRFFSAGFTGVAAWWLEKGKPISIEQASLQIARDILPDYLRLVSNQ